MINGSRCNWKETKLGRIVCSHKFPYKSSRAMFAYPFGVFSHLGLQYFLRAHSKLAFRRDSQWGLPDNRLRLGVSYFHILYTEAFRLPIVLIYKACSSQAVIGLLVGLPSNDGNIQQPIVKGLLMIAWSHKARAEMVKITPRPVAVAQRFWKPVLLPSLFAHLPASLLHAR